MALEVGGAGGLTRGELRRLVGQATGDYQLLVATAAGTTTTFIDDIGIGYSTDNILNRIIWCFAGTAANLGQSRRVTANDRATSTITVAALPAATAAGDQAELWSSHGQGVTPREVNEHINQAIRLAGNVTTVGALSATTTFSDTAPTIAIAADIQLVTGAQWQGADSIWYSVPPADLEIDAISRTVMIKNAPRRLAAGLPVRLIGYQRSGLLTTDAHETGIHLDWLINQVAFSVLLAASTRVNDHRRDDLKSRAQYHKGLAEQARGGLATLTRGSHRVRL